MNRSHVTVHELEVFLHLSETLNFRLAAERLHVSQPALSRTLQSAEEKLATRLFDRSTRRVELSPSGHALLPIARRLLSEFRGSLSDLSEFVAGRRGHVDVAAVPSAAVALMPHAMAGFARTHPQVTVHLDPAPAERLLRLVLDGQVDFALSVRPQEQDVVYESLLRDTFVLLCRIDDPLAQSAHATWSEFARRPFIASGTVTSVRGITDRVLAETGIGKTPRYESSNLAVLGAMVGAGLGISAIPRMAIRLMDTASLAMVPLRKPTAYREIGLLTRRGRSLSAASLLLMDLVRTAATEGVVPTSRPVTRRARKRV